jgi:O-antigen/teichoic acid export membrane protein
MVLTTVATNFGIQAATIAASVLSARILGAQGRGELALVLLYPQLVAQMLLLGCDRAVAVVVGHDPHKRHTETILLVSLILSVPAITVGYAVIRWRPHDPDLEKLSIVYLMYVFPVYVFILSTLAYNGLGNFRRYNGLRLAFYGVNLIALLVIFVVPTNHPLVLVVGANLASVFAAFGMAILCLFRDFPSGAHSGIRPVFDVTSVLKTAALFAPSGALIQLSLSAPQIILESAGTAIGLGSFVVFLSYTRIPAPLGNAIASHLLHRGITGRRGDVPRLIRVSILAHIFCAIPLLAVGKWVVPAIFGPSFQPSIWLLVLLSLAGLLAMISDSGGEFLKGARMVKADLTARTIHVVFLLIAGLLIVPSAGLLGLALIMVCSEATRLAIVLGACSQAAGESVSTFLRPSVADLRAVSASINVKLRRP